jgi:nitrate reductase gamma subunit
MRIVDPAVAVVLLLALSGVSELALGRWLLGVVFPYAAAAVFVAGVAARVLGWARSPVPFNITTTCGQQKSLSWIEPSRIENPSTTAGVVARMALEVLCFRSLFRNTRTQLVGDRLSYGSTKWLWAAGLAFHYAFLVVLLRHLRLFLEPVPAFVLALGRVDGFLLVGLPVVQATTALFLAALGFLLLRRIVSPPLRYLSLSSDYFPLLLLLAIGGTGAWLRHVSKIDVPAVKAMVMSLLRLSPQPAEGLGAVFYAHLFLVSVLLAYFPFSKLVHAGAIFLSPTRNLTANSREVRHVNPWNQPVPVHTYAEYEDEFRERMRDAGIPLEIDQPTAGAPATGKGA